MIEVVPEIIFTDELHQYEVEGQVRVSVTQALQDLGFINFAGVPPAVLEAARQRGKAVHACCHYIEDGDIDWGTVDQKIWPWVEAYALFKEDTGWSASMREQVVFQPLWNYCGQLDGFGAMPKLGLEKVLVDYKTGIPQKAARYQTAGYSLAIGEPYVPRCSVHLKGDGKYKIHWHRDFNDIAGWKAIVQTFHLKHRKD